MATTIAEIIDNYVYTQLQDSDNKLRWTRDELTLYANLAIRDLVTRRPESVSDSVELHLVAGARQTLPARVPHFRSLIANVARTVLTPVVTGANVNSTGTAIVITLSTGVEE